ncbi:MAG: helix-hairpin-helix domain-containing protein [Sedimentibacter sp.]|uniref:helix-hairpin-helix domain-containing protein n=1 Tax=Sedimentibacter sp. TaxID=1960295 RepID=UPI003159399D
MNNSLYKKGLAVVLIIAFIVMAAVGIKLAGREKDLEIIEQDETYPDTEDAEDVLEEITRFIYVDVDGAVNSPGVYEFLDGDRVIDAVEKAGGLKETAVTKNLNKARKLVDGEKIYIPEQGEEDESINQGEPADNGKININTATLEQLMSLNGIGEVYAGRIIDYRSRKKFSAIEEIKEVPGIGDKTFEKIKEMITIN